MILKRRVGPKGQVVIPKDVRDSLGIKNGSSIILEVKEDSVVIKPEKPAEQAVKDYTSVVKRKLAQEINLKKILQEEIEERVVLPR